MGNKTYALELFGSHLKASPVKQNKQEVGHFKWKIHKNITPTHTPNPHLNTPPPHILPNTKLHMHPEYEGYIFWSIAVFTNLTAKGFKQNRERNIFVNLQISKMQSILTQLTLIIIIMIKIKQVHIYRSIIHCCAYNSLMIQARIQDTDILAEVLNNQIMCWDVVS